MKKYTKPIHFSFKKCFHPGFQWQCGAAFLFKGTDTNNEYATDDDPMSPIILKKAETLETHEDPFKKGGKLLKKSNLTTHNL